MGELPGVAQVNRISVATRLACNVHNMGACLYVGGQGPENGVELLMFLKSHGWVIYIIKINN